MNERTRTIVSRGSLALSLAVLTACELEEITIADVQDVVIAEVYLDIRPERGVATSRAHSCTGPWASRVRNSCLRSTAPP